MLPLIILLWTCFFVPCRLLKPNWWEGIWLPVLIRIASFFRKWCVVGLSWFWDHYDLFNILQIGKIFCLQYSVIYLYYCLTALFGSSCSIFKWLDQIPVSFFIGFFLNYRNSLKTVVSCAERVAAFINLFLSRCFVFLRFHNDVFIFHVALFGEFFLAPGDDNNLKYPWKFFLWFIRFVSSRESQDF